MEARDLRRGPPRRWSEQLGGIRWLPRLIDKARAALAGTLGGYLFGQSPMDRGLLRELGLSHRALAEIVEGSPDDDAVLAALIARDPGGVERARAWSERLPREHRAFMFLMDLDDGYLGGGWQRLKTPINALTNGFTWLVKRAWPSRAAQR